MIIGLVGYKRSGKNTVANILTSKYGFTPYAFAGPIKEMCKEAFMWNDDHTEGPLKEIVDPYWGISPRTAMQWIGTEGFQYHLPQDIPEFANRHDRHIWVKRFIQWYSYKVNFYNEAGPFNVVLTDVRFPHEVTIVQQELKEFTPQFIRVNRKGIVFGSDMHESEIHIDKLPVKAEIYNDGDDINSFQNAVSCFFNEFFKSYHN